MTKKTEIEDLFFKQMNEMDECNHTHLAKGVHREYKFLENRRFKFDFAFVDRKIAIEVEGGVWTGGRHVNPVGFTNDCVKYNLALIGGWKVLRVTSSQVRDCSAILWLYELLHNGD